MRNAGTWSITARLTVAFAISVALIQFGASTYLYWSLKQEILAQDEAELIEHLREVRLVMLDDKSKVAALPRQWGSHVLSREGIYVRILGKNGVIVSESPGMIAPITAFPAPVALSSLPWESVRWRLPGREPEYMLMAAQATSGRPNDMQVIQAALDLSSAEQQFIAYRKMLTGVWLGVVLAAMAIGYAGTRSGLSELRRIAQTAGRINAAHFDERLGDHPLPKELREIAEAFDAMVARLRDAFGQLARFSADLAHEFRTPLNNLMSATSVTLSRPRTAEEYRELLERSMEQYDAMSRMIEAMLFLARTENREIQRQFRQVRASEEFGKIIDFFEAFADERSVTLSSRGDASFVADPALLRRALSNLVANALRHCAKGDTITLAASQSPSGRVILEVIDTGEGIDRKHLSHLFERFYQVDTSRTEGNAGLGLTIVKSIVELHGGDIAVSSNAGLGTTFTMEFPYAVQAV